MNDVSSTVRRLLAATALLLVCLLLPALGVGCSFDPARYFSKNACEVFNCEELFFVEDLFPLSAGPAGGAEAEPAAEEEGGH